MCDERTSLFFSIYRSIYTSLSYSVAWLCRSLRLAKIVRTTRQHIVNYHDKEWTQPHNGITSCSPPLPFAWEKRKFLVATLFRLLFFILLFFLVSFLSLLLSTTLCALPGRLFWQRRLTICRDDAIGTRLSDSNPRFPYKRNNRARFSSLDLQKRFFVLILFIFTIVLR